MAQPIEILIDEKTTDKALDQLSTRTLDCYDSFLLEAALKAGVTNIITDDGDFSTIPGIHVFTSNRNVIKTAGTQT